MLQCRQQASNLISITKHFVLHRFVLFNMSANMNPILNPKVASLNWKIDNFNTLTSGHIKSPNFSPPFNENISLYLVLYHQAKFRYTSNLSIEQIALLLNCGSKTTQSIEYRVSLVNAKGEKCHTIVKLGKLRGVGLVVNENRGCTYRRDIVLKPENGFLSENGSLTFYCEVEIIDEEKSQVTECSSSIAQDYGSLLESSKFSDVVLVVGGQERKAHKAILVSRSPVFAAMFEHDCEEKRTNRVDITDVDGEVFMELLRFIYTGKVESLDQHAADLLIAADKYQLDQLKSICSQRLVSHLTPESVAPTLVLADMHQVTELKDKCIEYITKQKGGIKLAYWKVICESNLELAHSLFQHAVQK